MYLMASTISRVCGWISRNIFQGKEKNNPSIAGIPSQQTSWQIKILSLFTSEVYMIFGVFAGEIFRGLDMFHHSSDLHRGIFVPRWFSTNKFWPRWSWGNLLSRKNALGFKGPAVSEKGKNLWGLMWIKLSRDSDPWSFLCDSNGAVFVVILYVPVVKGNHADIWSSVMNRNCTYHQTLFWSSGPCWMVFFHFPKSSRVENETRPIQQNSFSSLVASLFSTKASERSTPWKTNMSPENQWLEDVFPIEIIPF